MKTTDINQMSMLQLLDAFETRMEQLLEENSKKWEPDQEPHWMTHTVEHEILPLVSKLANWEPSDDEIVANNSCGTPWHDGCR